MKYEREFRRIFPNSHLYKDSTCVYLRSDAAPNYTGTFITYVRNWENWPLESILQEMLYRQGATDAVYVTTKAAELATIALKGQNMNNATNKDMAALGERDATILLPFLNLTAININGAALGLGTLFYQLRTGSEGNLVDMDYVMAFTHVLNDYRNANAPKEING